MSRSGDRRVESPCRWRSALSMGYFPGRGWITAFYEKVKNVKADVAAVLVGTQSPPAEVLNSVKGVRQDVHLDP